MTRTLHKNAKTISFEMMMCFLKATRAIQMNSNSGYSKKWKVAAGPLDWTHLFFWKHARSSWETRAMTMIKFFGNVIRKYYMCVYGARNICEFMQIVACARKNLWARETPLRAC